MTDEDYAVLSRLAGCATRLKTDEHFNELIKTMKSDVIREWSESKTVEAREKAHHDLHAIGRLEARMAKVCELLRLEKRTRGIT